MPLIVSPPALEPFLFIVSLAVAGLVVSTAWLRRSLYPTELRLDDLTERLSMIPAL